MLVRCAFLAFQSFSVQILLAKPCVAADHALRRCNTVSWWEEIAPQRLAVAAPTADEAIVYEYGSEMYTVTDH